MFCINSLILVIFIMLSMAYLTLLERKVLSYIQYRKGPNKLGFLGILQPFSDAIKLFIKEYMVPHMSNFLIYMISPIFMLSLSLFLWLIFPFLINFIDFNYSVLFFISCTGMGVYSIMISGWSSCSIYSLLGSLRAISQTISYEVSLALSLLSFLFLIGSFNFLDFYYYQYGNWFFFLSIPLSMCWYSSSLAETNRSPFDFAEGESELVSGFNVEYSGGGFMYIFMSEYLMIIFMSMLYVTMLLGCNLNSFLYFVKISLVSFLYIWVRGTLPRYRYDKLMYVAWKSYLPVSLNYFMFFFCLKFIL